MGVKWRVNPVIMGLHSVSCTRTHTSYSYSYYEYEYEIREAQKGWGARRASTSMNKCDPIKVQKFVFFLKLVKMVRRAGTRYEYEPNRKCITLLAFYAL